MRVLLILSVIFLLAGCGLFKKRRLPDPYPVVSFGVVHDRAGGLQPSDHVALTKWDDKYYYFEWRQIVEPATIKTVEGAGRVSIREFDQKNGKPLERRVGIIGKEDFNGQLYNAGVN
ncbi:MAG: hypothetical protein GWO24_19525 [Akkermansiaceae bacterium]|nr:hypothetical protein [Akkermansiaceae bacterium]